ncbi:hypothetical protein QE152_g37654 [Popillia japonica]|uniref:Uncharacterized protein n=1 Tax=Popillia japonica TaxID=7064 RepID=A0AAW1I9L4_POPJA
MLEELEAAATEEWNQVSICIYRGIQVAVYGVCFRVCYVGIILSHNTTYNFEEIFEGKLRNLHTARVL